MTEQTATKAPAKRKAPADRKAPAKGKASTSTEVLPISLTVAAAKALPKPEVLKRIDTLGAKVADQERTGKGLVWDASVLTYRAMELGIIPRPSDDKPKGEMSLTAYAKKYDKSASYGMMWRRLGVAAAKCGVKAGSPLWTALADGHVNGTEVGKYLDSAKPTATGLKSVYGATYDGIGGKKKSVSGTNTGAGQATPSDRMAEVVKKIDDPNTVALLASDVLVKALGKCDRATVAKVETQVSEAIASALDALVKTDRQRKAEANSNRSARTGRGKENTADRLIRTGVRTGAERTPSPADMPVKVPA